MNSPVTKFLIKNLLTEETHVPSLMKSSDYLKKKYHQSYTDYSHE